MQIFLMIYFYYHIFFSQMGPLFYANTGLVIHLYAILFKYIFKYKIKNGWNLAKIYM